MFAACAQFGTAVEINSRPERLDPPRELMQVALDYGCWFSIDTDAHATGQLEWQPHGCDRAAEVGVPIEQDHQHDARRRARRLGRRVTDDASRVPGALIAKGRSAEIFEYGAGKVLRRLRDGRTVPAHEPLVMRAVRAAGYPVPEVYEVAGGDMVMERVAGIDMVKDIERRPWRARRYGAMLADLHRRLGRDPGRSFRGRR